MATAVRELTVQEHGCMLLAELACRDAACAAEILDCTITVSAVVQQQLQEK